MKRAACISLFAVFALYWNSFSQDSPASAPASPSFTVDSIAIAQNVESRVPMGINSEFAWDVGRVFCWIRISSSQAPIPVKFVWYKNGELASEWSYSLIMESGRLWSIKAVATGNWKVEIVDRAKNVVKAASFVVKEHVAKTD